MSDLRLNLPGFAPALSRWREESSDRPLLRFAPSPTGQLHLGHVLHAVYVWGIAHALNGRVLLRIEDHDRLRCRTQYEEDIHDLLQFLELVPDTPDPADWKGQSDFRQSDCHAVYEAAARALGDAVYVCDCSRRVIQERTGRKGNAGDEVAYDGFCRERGLEDSEGRSLRVRLPHGEVGFEDLRLGPQVQSPDKECGDFVLRDNRGQWTYQFCVVVDDLRHGIELIVRGEDLLASTGRQIALRGLFGQQDVMRYYHHPLLMDDTGHKLSKSRFSQSIAQIRQTGASPADLLGEVALRAGWLAEPRPVNQDELREAFRAALSAPPADHEHGHSSDPKSDPLR